ncbi:cupin domain-containing protein [Pseudoalteromonas luteoviolacea]|nr:cupin domain-containing protein [Pseudoalteromonas luteoviolacea]
MMDKAENKILVNGPNSGCYVKSAGNLYREVINGEQTDGQFSLIESIIEPGQGGPFHTHANEQESFLVLNGTLTIFDGSDRYDATPGTFVFCPPGTLRGFRNETDERVKVLILYTPPGIEKMIQMEGEVLNSAEDFNFEATEQSLTCPRLNKAFGIVEDSRPLP